MGFTVIFDNALCYLIGKKGDEIFAFPRKVMEPELTMMRPKVTHLGHDLIDEEAVSYLSLSPWNGHIKKPSFLHYEEQFRLLIVKKIKQVNCSSVVILKSDFEQANSLWSDPSKVPTPNKLNYAHFGSRQLVNFLEAFCWVSQRYEVDCIEVGGGRDFDFQLSEKSSMSLFGRKGKPVLMFRWSEFTAITITNYTDFTIETLDGLWGAVMGRNGFPSYK